MNIIDEIGFSTIKRIFDKEIHLQPNFKTWWKKDNVMIYLARNCLIDWGDYDKNIS